MIYVVSDDRLEGLCSATVMSEALGRRADVTLYAAPGADQDSPLVILLHGIFGSHWNWGQLGRAHVALRALVEEGRVRPMILAMPSDGLAGAGSGYIDAAETWVRDEVPMLVRSVFPGAGEKGVCIAGLSMGGFGALRIAARHPERFVAAAGTSSVTRLGHLRNLSEAVPSHEEWLRDSIIGAASVPPFRLDCGLDDDLIEPNRRLVAALHDAGIGGFEYHEFPGGHDWAYWSARIGEIFVFFEQVLSHTAP